MNIGVSRVQIPYLFFHLFCGTKPRKSQITRQHGITSAQADCAVKINLNIIATFMYFIQLAAKCECVIECNRLKIEHRQTDIDRFFAITVPLTL